MSPAAGIRIALFCLPLVVGLAHGQAGEAEEPAAEPETAGGPVFSPEVEALLNEASDPEGYGTRERCISIRNVRSTKVLDDRHVVFELPSKQYYLVQFQNRCFQLRPGASMAYEPRGTQLCRLDDIRVIDGFRGGPVGPPCSIPGFYEISEEQVALLRDTLKAGRQSRTEQPAQ